MERKSPNMRGCSSCSSESPRRINSEIHALFSDFMGWRWLPGKRKTTWLVCTQTGIIHITEILQFLFSPQEVDVNILFADKFSFRVCVYVEPLQLCPTLCNLKDHSTPASTVYGISQERILVWVAMSSSSSYFQNRDWSCISWMGTALQADSKPLSHCRSPLKLYFISFLTRNFCPILITFAKRSYILEF